MSRYYVDSEFNAHGGQLISLAIAAEDGRHWYGVLPLPQQVDPWVDEHVVPQLFALPPTCGAGPVDLPLFRASLCAYLRERPGAVYYADWPGDFAHLMACMEGPTYDSHWMVECRMHLLVGTDPKPKVPHNALSDAIALMAWHLPQTQPIR